HNTTRPFGHGSPHLVLRTEMHKWRPQRISHCIGEQYDVCEGSEPALWRRDHIGKYDVRHSGDQQTAANANGRDDHKTRSDRPHNPAEHIRREQLSKWVRCGVMISPSCPKGW